MSLMSVFSDELEARKNLQDQITIHGEQHVSVARALNDQKRNLEKRGRVASANQEAGLSESSLGKEWLSPEDNRWDDLLK